MNQQGWCKGYHYIDAFAGSGRETDPETQKYIEGSPLRALRTNPPFDGYWFIEISPSRVDQLRSLKQEFPRKRIEIIQGDANDVLSRRIISEITYNLFQRGLIFLDPYGLDIKWETVVSLARAKAFDVFINFSLAGVIRQLKRNQPPRDEVRQNLHKRDTIHPEWVAQVYSERVKEVFKHVSRPVIMRNSQNGPLYALMLASHKEVATEIMDEINAFGQPQKRRE